MGHTILSPEPGAGFSEEQVRRALETVSNDSWWDGFKTAGILLTAVTILVKVISSIL